MGAQKMGYFSRAEFRTGLSELGASSLAQLRKVLPTLATEVRPARQRGPPPPTLLHGPLILLLLHSQPCAAWTA